MRCAYCGVEVLEYPANGICVHCGGRLPARPAGIRCSACGTYSSGNFCTACGRSLNGSAPVQPVQVPVQPVYVPVQQMPCHPAATCPKCGSLRIIRTRRGFRWGLGIFGFFFVPFLGIFLGFCGSKKPIMKCADCRRKWKPY